MCKRQLITRFELILTETNFETCKFNVIKATSVFLNDYTKNSELINVNVFQFKEYLYIQCFCYIGKSKKQFEWLENKWQDLIFNRIKELKEGRL